MLTTLSMVHWVAADLGGLEHAASGLLRLGDQLGLRESREWASYYLGIYHYQRGELGAAERCSGVLFAKSVSNIAQVVGRFRQREQTD